METSKKNNIDQIKLPKLFGYHKINFRIKKEKN